MHSRNLGRGSPRTRRQIANLKQPLSQTFSTRKPRAAVADDCMSRQKRIADKERDGFCDVVWFTDPADLHLRCIVRKDLCFLSFQQEVPLRGIDYPGRNAVHPQSPKPSGENGYQCRNRGISSTNASCPRHGSMRSNGRDERNTSILTHEGCGSLRTCKCGMNFS
jgi:hypothetical protein